MANKVKTRFDAQSPNKNKIATLVGVTVPEQTYVDLFAFKIEHNGVEMPLNKFLEKLLDEKDKLDEAKKLLIKEVESLQKQIKIQQEIIKGLDERLIKLETIGNL
jgi:predicted ribosome quality control (RQC) complex YloA/Tae2 family protein